MLFLSFFLSFERSCFSDLLHGFFLKKFIYSGLELQTVVVSVCICVSSEQECGDIQVGDDGWMDLLERCCIFRESSLWIDGFCL